jgi:hypothetical protein
MKYEISALITPQRLINAPHEAFNHVPPWAAQHGFVGPEDNEPEAIVVLIGGKHQMPITLSLAEYALLCEATRFGHNIVTNSNFGKPLAIIYAKISFRDAAKDNIPLGRIFAGATTNEAVKTLEIASDLRPDNLYRIGAGKPEKSARDLVLRHCERLARERQAGHTLLTDFDIDAYVANIRNLFAFIDAELDAVTKGD